MNYLPQQTALLTLDPADAEFAESAMHAYGFEVIRYDSLELLARDLSNVAAKKSNELRDVPTLVVVAGKLPGLVDEKIVPQLAEAAPEAPVVVIGSQGSVATAVDLMRQGASDIIALPCERETLRDRLRRTVELTEPQRRSMSRKRELKERLGELTKAEQEVLQAILDGKSNKQIAQMLSIGLRTVELRRSKIMRKMKARSIAELIKLVCLAGACDEPAETSAAPSGEGMEG
jgi:FixJ family two-component response regulator